MRGRRLSEQTQARSAVFAVTLIRDLMPPLAALQAHADGVSHGTLNSDRILVTPDGRLIVVDHLLGAAVDVLDLPTARQWSELGVLQPGLRRRIPQVDVVHVALLALSSMVGRPIDPAEYSYRLGGLVDRYVLYAPLRLWLEGALGLEARHSGRPKRRWRRCNDIPDGREPDARASLAAFGRKAAEPPPAEPGPPGFTQLLHNEGGTAFRPVRTSPPPNLPATRIDRSPSVRGFAPGFRRGRRNREVDRRCRRYPS